VGNFVTTHRVRAWAGRAFATQARRRAALFTATLLLVSGIGQLEAIPAAAAKPLPLSFTSVQWAYSLQDPVEQQSPDFFFGPGAFPQTWVVNPTGCVWDVDDNQVHYATGYLGAGQSIGDGLCLDADWAGLNYSGHLAGVALGSPSANLQVTISFSPGWSFTAQPVWDSASKQYLYRACSATPSYSSVDPALQSIPGSNGGLAVPTHVDLTVTNTSARRATVVVQWKVGHYWTASSFC